MLYAALQKVWETERANCSVTVASMLEVVAQQLALDYDAVENSRRPGSASTTKNNI
jgi:hypothetical protein